MMVQIKPGIISLKTTTHPGFFGLCAFGLPAFALSAFVLTAFVLSVFTLSIPVLAQDKSTAAKKRLGTIETQIKTAEEQQQTLEEKASALKNQARSLAERMVAVAVDIRQAENNAFRTEARISALEIQMQAKTAALGARKEELVTLLAALQRLSTRPAATTLLQPREALTTARSAQLMGKLVPLIDAQADLLKKELAALTAIQTDLSAERYALKGTLSALTARRKTMASLHGQRLKQAKSANLAARAQARKLVSLSRQAGSLRELIDKLEQRAAKIKADAKTAARLKNIPAPAAKPRSKRSIRQAKGRLPYPAVGQVVMGFGAQDGAVKSKGIKIYARRNGQVVAPYDGEIVYAGPFMNYGELLIIAHGGGYHSLVAGMNSRYRGVGQWVLTGEPIGQMGAHTAGRNLYMELRFKGKAINPAAWFNRQAAVAG